MMFIVCIPYPFVYNHRFLFFNKGFWVRFIQKIPQKVDFLTKKWGFYSRKTPKTGILKKDEGLFKSEAVYE